MYLNAEDLAYKIKADFLKTLSHPIRLQIVDFLKDGEKSVGVICKALKIPQSSLSRHLLDLREGGVILKSRQEGTIVYYAIEDDTIFQVLRLIPRMIKKKLNKTSEVLSSIEKY
jgi:DNA-binding transcriptional ArsR family regulator